MTASKASEPSIARIEEAHSGFTKTMAQQNADHEAYGFKHRSYTQSNQEECYICALMRQVAKAEARAAELAERKRPWTPEHTKSVIDGQVKEIDRLTALVKVERERADGAERKYETCKMEAQIHAQEARTANATIAEIYQVCTGATGEPGNWHGAEPVRQVIATKEAAELDAGRYRHWRKVWCADDDCEAINELAKEGYDTEAEWDAILDAALRRSAP